jgi:hypothetical protein
LPSAAPPLEAIAVAPPLSGVSVRSGSCLESPHAVTRGTTNRSAEYASVFFISRL